MRKIIYITYRKLKIQNGMSDQLSVISENTVFTGKVTHAEKNLTKIDQSKAKELDRL